MNDFIQIFIDHLLFDKEFVEELLPRFQHEFELLGKFLQQHSPELFCKDTPDMEELFDFLDGNGFEVIRPQIPIPWDPHPIKLRPIYIEEEIYEETSQSAFSEYFSVQETVLSYTSMEDCERYILEYKKFLASWTFWLRVCRRVELLRLVPEGRCGSTPVPRPP